MLELEATTAFASGVCGLVIKTVTTAAEVPLLSHSQRTAMQITRCCEPTVARLNSHKCTFALILIGIVRQWRQATSTSTSTSTIHFRWPGFRSESHAAGKAVNWRLPAARYWLHNPDDNAIQFVVDRTLIADRRSLMAERSLLSPCSPPSDSDPETFGGIGIGCGSGRNRDSGASCMLLYACCMYMSISLKTSSVLACGCEAAI